jgi:hypothetical protein
MEDSIPRSVRDSNWCNQRDARFGYIEMPENMRLKEAINMGDYRYDLTDEISYITIAPRRRFDLMSGKTIDQDPFQ